MANQNEDENDMLSEVDVWTEQQCINRLQRGTIASGAAAFILYNTYGKTVEEISAITKEENTDG